MKACFTVGSENSAEIASRACPGAPRLSETRQCWRPLLASTKLIATGSIRAARSTRQAFTSALSEARLAESIRPTKRPACSTVWNMASRRMVTAVAWNTGSICIEP